MPTKKVITSKTVPQNIVPASYSRAQSAEEVTKHLEAYPEQRCNTTKGFAHTLEFQIAGLPGNYTSLAELQKIHPDCEDYLIHCRVNDDIVHVRWMDGIFIVEDVI